MKNYVIAIDGPSGAGKSTIAKQLSFDLGITYLDTGAMYRAVGLYCYRNGIDIFSGEQLEANLDKIAIDMGYSNGQTEVVLNGEDVSTAIRENHISQMASDVSKLVCVRLAMVEKQREIARGKSIVMDGREIGTFVFPDAKVKFYLDATSEERADRRHKQLLEKGENIPVEVLKAEIEKRDENDKNREFAPLKRADDAIFVDSTHMTLADVVAYMSEKTKEIIAE
ncbi:MAG: (d)CMP kinase [Bacillota bacterium]